MKHTCKRCLGIDIGGMSAKYSIISESGALNEKSSFRTGCDMTREQFVGKLYETVEHALPNQIDGIGICSLGFINTETGEILGGVENLPFLEGMNIRKLLTDRFPNIPVSIQNDVKAVALGEQWLGAGRNCKSFFCITFGTGLGGALVLNGNVVEGTHFRAGEICYLQYQTEHDYFEKKVSTKYLVEQAAKRLEQPEMDGFRFFGLYRADNAVCVDLLNAWAERIGRCIADLTVTLDLEKVIVGGGISDEKDILIPLITRKVNRMLPAQFRNQCAIVAAECANDAGMLGAVSPMLWKARD